MKFIIFLVAAIQAKHLKSMELNHDQDAEPVFLQKHAKSMELNHDDDAEPEFVQYQKLPGPEFGFQPWHDGVWPLKGGRVYHRVIPERFSGDSDDQLMKSILTKYAVEMRDPKTGEANGQFFVDESGAFAIAREVIATHMGMKGAELEKYFSETVPKAWARFDVNNDGIIEATRVPQFLRLIVGNVEQAFGLQMQVAANTRKFLSTNKAVRDTQLPIHFV